MAIEVGQIVNERYRIAKKLSQSEFGAVFRAWDLTVDGPCLLQEYFDTSPAAQELFSRQAAQLIGLEHPNLPNVFDAFTLPGEGHYLAMDYIEGQDLQTIFEQTDGPLSEEQVMPAASQICDALSFLHSQIPPVLHGDIRPSHIRITPEGQAFLVGFSIAEAGPGPAAAALGGRLVSPGFSSPEKYGKGASDARTDVYALGASIYSLLAGKRLPESVLIKGKDVPAPRPLGEVNPQVRPVVAEAIDRAIQIEPGDRFPSIQDFKTALLGVPAAEVIPSRPLPAKKTGRPRWVLVTLGILIFAVVAAGLFFGGRWALDFVAEQLATDTPAPPTATVMLPTNTLASTDTPQPSPTNTEELPPTPTESGEFIDPRGVPMVLIPAGEFQMGSPYGAPDEMPVHAVSLSAYYIDLYEVTNDRYADCVTDGACSTPFDSESATRTSYYSDSNYANFPVIQVNWDMAVAYCEWREARLPTEAEWEYAARGSDGRMFPWSGTSIDCTLANYWGSQANCIGDTTEVGSYPNGVSPFGIFDMAGNVWEWVADWYDPGYYSSSPSENPTGPQTGGHRIVRGGSWNGGLNHVRVTTRGRNLPGKGYNYVGFRCARTP